MSFNSNNKSPYTSFRTAIQIDKSSLLTILNKQVDQAIRTLAPQQVEIGYVIVKKEGFLHLDISGTQVRLEIPLTLYFKGEKLLSSLAAQASVRLYFKSDIDFKPYWQLTTNTELERYQWLEEPDIQLSRLNIPVERLADQLLEKNKVKIEQLIDGAISDYWANTGVAKLAESFFQKQHQLSPDFPFFIRLLPERIHIAPIYDDTDSFHSILHSDLHIELSTETSTLKSNALPTPSIEDIDNSKTSGLVNVLLSYSAIQQLLQKQLVGQSFSYRNYSITVKTLSLKKSGDHIQIIAFTSGSLNGRILIEGEPLYNEQSNTLTIDMHNFQIKTDSFWKQSAAKLLGGRIKEALEEKLLFNLDDIPKRAELLKLQKFQPTPDVIVCLNTEDVRLSNFNVGEAGISCLLHIKMDMNLSFKSK